MTRSSTIRTAAIALAFLAGTVAYAQPKIEIVGGDTYDWGKVKPGKLTTEVQVKNVGNQELKITEVRPACGCTAAPIDKNLLKPGEVGKINITLDVTTRSGPVEKTVTITSNDSSAPSRVLRLKADIHRAVTISPTQYVMINNGKVGVESEAAPITIKNTGETAFTVEAPRLEDGATVSARFDMSGTKELKPGEELVLKAYLTPGDASKPIGGKFTMKTSSSESPSIEIPIYGSMSRPETTQAPTGTK